MSKKIIVFAPHPDDETLGCGGTIAKKISEGYEALVVVITDGRHSFSKGLGIDSDPTPEEVKKIRKEEVKRATKILGLPKENLLFLHFIDCTIEKNERKVQEEIIRILRENPPVEIYFPYEKDCHLDHRATNRIVRNSIRKLGIRPTSYKYTIVSTYARLGPLIDRFLNLFRRNIIYVDVSAFLRLKEKAMGEFKSELTVISSRQKEPRSKNFKKFLRRKERFYIA